MNTHGIVEAIVAELYMHHGLGVDPQFTSTDYHRRLVVNIACIIDERLSDMEHKWDEDRKCIAKLKDELEHVAHSCEANAEKQLRPSVMRDEFRCLAASCRSALKGR